MAVGGVCEQARKIGRAAPEALADRRPQEHDGKRSQQPWEDARSRLREPNRGEHPGDQEA